MTLFVAAASAQVPDDACCRLRGLRFSPDGKYALAQANTEITVLSVQPFAAAFQLPAKDAGPAHFTPDSANVVFLSTAPAADSDYIASPQLLAHLERWRIADRARYTSTEFGLPDCQTIDLSPDGGVVACADVEGTLRLINTGTGETVFEKKKFARGDPDDYGGLGNAFIDFSPDGRFVIAEPVALGPAIAFDIERKKTVPLSEKLERLSRVASPFCFIAADAVAILNGHTALMVSFPSGAPLGKVKVPVDEAKISRAANPDFILVHRVSAVAVQLRSGADVIIADHAAMDVSGPYYLVELNGGEVGLYLRAKREQAGKVKLREN